MLDDPVLAAGRRAVELILAGHEPHPALAVDRHLNLVSANRAVAPLLAGADQTHPAPPVNVPRLSLHPACLPSRNAPLQAWPAHIPDRLAPPYHDPAGDGPIHPPEP